MQPVSKVKTGEAETNKQMVLSDVIPTLVSYLSKKDEKKKETEETENKEEEIKALEEGDESKYETTLEKEEEIVEEKPLEKAEEQEVIEEMEDKINLKSKCIYFIQVQEGRRTPFWCIKDNNDFVEI